MLVRVHIDQILDDAERYCAAIDAIERIDRHAATLGHMDLDVADEREKLLSVILDYEEPVDGVPVNPFLQTEH